MEQKKTYAVIGHPIGHTMSPFIHQRLFAPVSYTHLDVYKRQFSAPLMDLYEIPNKSANCSCV